jgi:hypothetical protein
MTFQVNTVPSSSRKYVLQQFKDLLTLAVSKNLHVRSEGNHKKGQDN